MRHITTGLVLLLLLLCNISANAQVSNLTVNGSSTDFTMASGDAVSWQYNVPTGETAFIQIWLDLNENGAIDTVADKLYAAFTQTDGLLEAGNGPPDLDGTANGVVVFSQPVGLVPAKYAFSVTIGGVGPMVTGTVTPLLSPNATITGTVTPPTGASKKNIIVEASQRNDSTGNGEGSDIFWDALTDSTGFYTINLHVDTTTTFWRVNVQDNFAPYVSTPSETTFTLHTSATGIDFYYIAAAAQVTGRVYDQAHAPLADIDVMVGADTGNSYRYTRTDVSGYFRIGFLPGDLNGGNWHLETSQMGWYTSTALKARRNLGAINLGDSLYRELTVYTVNSQIEGYIRVNGAAPGYRMDVTASGGDSATAIAPADSVSGHFVIPVSDQIAEYQLFVWPMPWNGSMTPVSALPGDSGKILNIITTSVIERGSSAPAAFALRQNYPNPFNPSTGIQYDLPAASNVRLAVYDMLGREVAVLMDGEQEAGSYTARFDASPLPSGVYFARLTAGKHVATQKMLLMK